MHRWDCTRTLSWWVFGGHRRSRQSPDAEERRFHHQPCSIIGLDSPEDWMMPWKEYSNKPFLILLSNHILLIYYKGNSTVSSWEWTVTHQPSSTYTQTWATLTLEPEDQEYMQFSFNALGMKEWHLDLSFAFQEKLLNKYTILKSFRNFQKGLVYPQEKWHIHCSAELNITNSEYNNNN